MHMQIWDTGKLRVGMFGVEVGEVVEWLRGLRGEWWWRWVCGGGTRSARFAGEALGKWVDGGF